MNFLVTGGAGFIGSHLVDNLLSENTKVIIYDNFDTFYSRDTKLNNIKGALASPKAALIEGDIRNKELLNQVLKNESVDLVIHLAAKAGVRPSIENIEEHYDVNVNGTVNLLQCMKANNVTKMIFASSSSVYGNSKLPCKENSLINEPISPYAATKISGELLCHVYNHLFNFDITCLRFFTVFGPRQRPDLAIHKFTKLIQANKPIPLFGDGSSSRDYTYITDIISGIRLSLSNLKGYRIYNLGQSKTTQLNELIMLLAELLQKKITVNKLTKQNADAEVTFADISKAHNELGYTPKIGVKEGLHSFIEWYLKNNPNH